MAESLEARDLLAITLDLGQLSTQDGYILLSTVPQDRAGFSVSTAGDVNADGFDDLLIGAPVEPGFPAGTGQAFLVYGQAERPTEPLNLIALTGDAGAVMFGLNVEDHAGYSVSGAGDINGDGFHDVIVGSPAADRFTSQGILPGAGQAHVVFGGQSPPSVLSGFDGTDGFELVGNAPFDRTGLSVGSAGDVNGDGFDDLIVGGPAAPVAFPFVEGTGQAYLVFGKASGFDASILVSLLAGGEGVWEIGLGLGDHTGFSVSGIGDLNSDGFDDFAIGAPFADRVVSGGGLFGSGTTYVVFGTDGDLPALAELNGVNGFRVEGLRAFDRSGFEVNSAGDVNGDGFDDLVIGAPADADFPVTAGEAYVVYGQEAPYSSVLNLGDLDGSNGFAINGIGGLDHAGFSVAAAGDVNGDGLDDLLVGAPFASPSDDGLAEVAAGESYVVFGRDEPFPFRFGLGELADDEGIVLRGDAAFDHAGYSVSAAGDVDGDGFDDILIGAPSNFAYSFRPGRSYVVYGQDFTGAGAIAGGAGDNLIRGDAGSNDLIGGTGNDTLEGAGGFDLLLGAQGNDVLSVSNLLFQRVDGGRGTDLLSIAASDVHLDLTEIPDNRLRGIEAIDLTGTGDNQLTIGNAREVLNLSDTSNRLLIRRDAGDVVDLGSGWGEDRTEVDAGVVYRVFQQGAAEVWLANLAPVVDLNGPANGTSFVTAFTEDDPPIQVVDSGATLLDEDMIVTASITLINPLDGEDESLAVTAAFGISAVYEATLGKLQLTGAATPDEYTQVLQTLSYRNSSQNPVEINRSVTVVVSDGLAHSVAATSTVSVTRVNDAPVLDVAGSPQLSDITEDETDPLGDRIDAIVLVGSISDPDEIVATSVAVVGAATANGSWQYALDSQTWNDLGVPSAATARLLGAGDRLRFLPAPDFHGTAAIEFRAWDQQGGVAGAVADTRITGGTTSFSESVETALLTVTPVNDAPQLDPVANPMLTAILRDDALVPGDKISEMVVDGSITDVDGTISESVAVISVDETGGQWEQSADGIDWAPISATENAALLLGPDWRVRFVPVAGYFGSATLTFRAWDQSTGSAGGTADTTANGGTSAYSVEVDTVQIEVQEIDHPPTLDVLGSPLIVSAGTDSVNVGLSGISDGGNMVETLSVTATSSNPEALPDPTVSYTSPDATGTLTLIPTVAAAGWSIISVEVREDDGDAVLRTFAISVGENPLVWQNPVSSFDVNSDTFVAPADVLRIINELNSPQFGNAVGQLPNPPPAGAPPSFFDVNGDGFVTPADALRLINFLNANGGGEGEAVVTSDGLRPDGLQPWVAWLVQTASSVAKDSPLVVERVAEPSAFATGVKSPAQPTVSNIVWEDPELAFLPDLAEAIGGLDLLDLIERPELLS